METAFLAAGPGPRSVPMVDLRILDALVTHRALRSWLYRTYLASYSDLELLCTIAQEGLLPPWLDPSRRRGVRPVPVNYPGADTGVSIVTDKLFG
ncbi:hypothetical protein PPTG_14827 [Phytophthora nicotianae INRA-310]|uniref:Uncharacterized protein n=3 Tax=Phytophthora nicotianae TaxID=4792 RepID=W2PY32_PHYN3|nr:hypothetical protein PPTG_14827 [Phytophthora nicotianae INRA-310]ETI40475.1 hypothetical protein F443_14135 [Phytophthora nicotianae P1569]ETN05184.1 hypothetical protein PPTG_14827 [Phytophthora nicotianae INRA-310]